MRVKTDSGKYTTTFVERGSFWLFGIGMLFYYSIVGSYLNTFLVLQGVDLAKVSLIFLGVKIWDAFNDPLFAYIFDKIKFKKEKCLPWLRIAAVIMPLASIAVFNMPVGWTETGKLIWFAATYVLWDAAYTVCDVPFFAMTTTMTTNLNERNTLFSMARVFHGAGQLFCTTIMTWLIGEKVGMGFGQASLIVCGIGVLFTLPLCFLGKERCHQAQKEQGENYTVRQMFTYLGKNKNLLAMYAGQLIPGILATTGVAGLVGTFYIYGDTTHSILTTWLNMIPGPLLGMLLPFILRKVDKFKLYIACNIFNVLWNAFFFAAYFMGLQTVNFAIVSSVVTALPSTMSGLLAYMFTMDCAEYGEYKSGIKAKGINFAVQTFTAKLPGAFSTSLGLFLLGLTSFVMIEANSIAELAEIGYVQTQQAMVEMWCVTRLPALLGSIIGLVIHLTCYKLNDKDVQIMAKCNAGEITREEAEMQLSRKY